jgi:SAM-dependent methyltransferase
MRRSPAPCGNVKDYYMGQVRYEWRRLVRDAYNRLELETTLHYLNQYLPDKGLVLDAGGGPGRYTIELARRGYDVALLDYAPANLEYARRQIKRAGLQRRVKEVTEGSITDLSRYADGSFDAVLCTGGPLSHVIEHGQRERAIAELVRVTRPGAPLFVSVMSRLSVLAVELSLHPEEIEGPDFEGVRDIGDYSGGAGFTACHFYLPEELRADFCEQPLEVLEMVGLEGISSNHRKAFNAVARNPARYKIWMETHYATCTHPCVVGISEHMLIVCRKM